VENDGGDGGFGGLVVVLCGFRPELESDKGMAAPTDLGLGLTKIFLNYNDKLITINQDLI